MTLNSAVLQPSPIAAESFAEAYGKGFRLTVRFLLSKGATVDTAEELAQTAWVRGWEARCQLQLESRLLPWINSIAYHRFCNDRRRSVRHCELIEIADGRTPGPAAALDADVLLNLCSPLDKALLTQRYLEGLEMKEIAAVRGLSEIAVRVRIHRCQCALRSQLQSGARKSKWRASVRRPIPIAAEFDEACAA